MTRVLNFKTGFRWPLKKVTVMILLYFFRDRQTRSLRTFMEKSCVKNQNKNILYPCVMKWRWANNDNHFCMNSSFKSRFVDKMVQIFFHQSPKRLSAFKGNKRLLDENVLWYYIKYMQRKQNRKHDHNQSSRSCNFLVKNQVFTYVNLFVQSPRISTSFSGLLCALQTERDLNGPSSVVCVSTK